MRQNSVAIAMAIINRYGDTMICFSNIPAFRSISKPRILAIPPSPRPQMRSHPIRTEQGLEVHTWLDEATYEKSRNVSNCDLATV